MTTIMNKVTCALCDIKVDESKWGEHLISTDHLDFCSEDKNELTKRFFDLVFDTYHNRSEIYDLKNEKAHYFWEGYFESTVPKEKFDKLCSDSINKSELEDSLLTDLRYFINNYTCDIGENFFDTPDKITSCRICNTDVHKSRAFNHFNSKEHRDAEDYFKMKCMTYCERCDMEIKNDKWRAHLISYTHLDRFGEKYCDVCKKKYTTTINGKYSSECERNHLESDTHKKNQKRLGFYAKDLNE